MSGQIQGEFDFSGLLELFNQIKRKFWSYDRSQERQAKQRAKLHNMFFSKLNPGGQLSDVSKKIQKELHRSAKRSNGITYQKWKPSQKEDDSDDQNNTYLPSDEQLNEILGLSDNELKKLLSYQDAETLLQSKLLKFINEPKKQDSFIQKQKQALPDQQQKEQSQKEPVKIDWFKDYIQQTDQDDYKAKSLEILLKKMADAEQKASYFFTDEIYELRYDRYQSMLKDYDIRDKITQNLVEKYPQFKNQQKQISAQIQKADKDLFIRLRDGNFTLDQLKARMAERRNNVKYVVLDDLLEILGPNFQQIYERSLKQQTKVQNLNKLQKKQRKPKNSQCFEAVPRSKGMKHQNYQIMPESFTIDFKQPEISEKQERIIQQPKYKLAQSVPKLKVNYQELAQKRRENMMDPEKQKKMLNVEKLKKNLAKKLILHRQLEISQMPFDSSKVAYHDMMDMFFRQSDLRNTLPSPENQLKKDNLNNSAENNQEVQKSKGRMSDYLQAFEQKKIEQKKRRMKLLFLKRLENDGVRILMSQQDRDLLKNFGNYQKQNDETDLNQAMDADFSDCKQSDKEMTKQDKPNNKKESFDEQDPEAQFEQLQINKLKYKCALTKAVELYKQKQSIQGTQQVKEKLFKTRDNKDIEIISTVKQEDPQNEKEDKNYLQNENLNNNMSTHYIKVQNQNKINRLPILFENNLVEENQNIQKCQSSPNINYQIVKSNPMLWKTSTAANSQAEGLNIKPQLTSTNQSRNYQTNYKSQAVQNFPQVKDAFSATIGESEEQTVRNQMQQQYIENFQIQNPKSLQVTQFLKNEGHHIFSKNSLQNTQDILSLQQNINVEIINPSNEKQEDNNQYYQHEIRGQTVLTKSSYLQEALQSPINSFTFYQNLQNEKQIKQEDNSQINKYLADQNSDHLGINYKRKTDQTNSNKEIKTLDQILFSNQNYDQYEESRNGDHQMLPIGPVLMNNTLEGNQEQNNKQQIQTISKTRNTSPLSNNERPQSKQANFIDISKAASIFQAHQTGEQILIKRNMSKKVIQVDSKDQFRGNFQDRNLINNLQTYDGAYDKTSQMNNLVSLSQRKIQNEEIFDKNIRRQSLQNQLNSIPLQTTQSTGQLSNQIAISQVRQKYKTSQNLSGEKNKQIRQSIENQQNNKSYTITQDLKNFANNLGIPIFQKPKIITDSNDGLSPLSNQEIKKRKLNALKSQQKTIIQNYQTNSIAGTYQIEDKEEGLSSDNAIIKQRNYIGTQSTINTYLDQNNFNNKNSNRIKRVINSGIQRNASEGTYSRLQFQKGPVDPKYVIDQNDNKISKIAKNENQFNSLNREFHQNVFQKIDKKETNIKFSKFKNMKFQSRQTNKNDLFLSDQIMDKTKLKLSSILNPTQDRLKTALLNQRQKKDNFNMQLQQKNIIQNTGFLNNNEAFLTLDKEMAELNLRSLQLDTLQYQLMKKQCKVNNDYKSMAALARLQQRNQYDSIKTLHQHELIQKSLDKSLERQIVRSTLNEEQFQVRKQIPAIEYPAAFNYQNQQSLNIDIDQNYLMMAQSAQNTLSQFNKNQINLETNYKNQKTSYDNSRVSRINLLQKYNSNKYDEQSQENMYTSSSRGIISKQKQINANKNSDLQKYEGSNFSKRFELKKFGDIENNTISLQNDQRNRIGFLKSAAEGMRNQSKIQNDLQVSQNVKTDQKNKPNMEKAQEKNSQKTLETGENSKSFYMKMSSINNNQQAFRQFSENKFNKV